tara:strand:+ start:1408 stop:2031 length:624 start_codon:yes stop_codon:yes gene_type:complete
MAYINLNGVALATESGGTVTLDNGVAQASGFTLGSGVTFPAGHIIQMNYTRNVDMTISRTGDKSSVVGTGVTCILANDLQASSKLFAQFTTQIGEQDGSHWAIQTFMTLFNNSVDLAPYSSATNNEGAGLGSASHVHGATHAQYQSANVAGQILFTPTGSGAARRTVELGWGSTSTSSFVSRLNRSDNVSTSYRSGGTTILLMEIAQ